MFSVIIMLYYRLQIYTFYSYNIYDYIKAIS